MKHLRVWRFHKRHKTWKIWVLVSTFLCSRITHCKSKQKGIHVVQLQLSRGYQRGSLNVRQRFLHARIKGTRMNLLGKMCGIPGRVLWSQLYTLSSQIRVQEDLLNRMRTWQLQTPQRKQQREGGKPWTTGPAPAEVIKFCLTKFPLHPQQDTGLLSTSKSAPNCGQCCFIQPDSCLVPLVRERSCIHPSLICLTGVFWELINKYLERWKAPRKWKALLCYTHLWADL